MTPSKFARNDRHTAYNYVTYIIAGRNNPNLDVATRSWSGLRLSIPNWLLLGQGRNVYRFWGSEAPLLQNEAVFRPWMRMQQKIARKLGVETSINNQIIPVNQQIVYKEKPFKEVSRIIIYYSDNSFEEFLPERSIKADSICVALE